MCHVYVIITQRFVAMGWFGRNNNASDAPDANRNTGNADGKGVFWPQFFKSGNNEYPTAPTRPSAAAAASWKEMGNAQLAPFGIEIVDFPLAHVPWQMEHSILLITSCFASGWLGYRLPQYWNRHFRRITAVEELRIGGGSALRGRVMDVKDGDTFRWYHCPTPSWWHSWSVSQQLGNNNNNKTSSKRAKQEQLAIRISTIDTPETAKFGSPGQPYGEEAKKCLSDLILHRMVDITVLSKDQYGRVVAHVNLVPRMPWWFGNGRSVEQYMLQRGMAEVYVGSGAVYGPLGKQAYLDMQTKAQEQKMGIWSLKNRESAAEFKARVKLQKSQPENTKQD